MTDRPQSPPGTDDAGRGLAAPTTAPSTKRTLLSGTFWQSIPQLLPLVFNLALTPYLIHGVGPDIYGIFLLVMALQYMLSSLDGGIGPSANRNFGIYAGRGDRAASTRLLFTLEVLILAVSVPLFVAIFFFTPAIVAFFPGTAADPAGAALLLQVMVAIVVLSQVRGLFSQLLFTHNRFAVQSMAETLGYVGYAAGMIWTVETGSGLAGMTWSFLAQQAIGTLIVIPPAARLLEWRAARFLPGAELREFFAYAWKIQVSGVVNAVSAQGDSFFVGKFAAAEMTPFGTGQSFASTLRNVPMNAMSPIRTMMGHGLGGRGAAEAAVQADRLQRAWVRAIAGWVAVGAPAALFGVTAWLHLGTDLPGIVAAVVLVAHGAMLVVLVQRLWANTLGDSGLTMHVDVATAVAKVALTIPLILPFGALGAVAATLVANVGCAILLGRLAARLEHPLSSAWREVPWGLALGSAALSALCCWAVATFVVGAFVPLGPLALFAIGLAAAPALALYVLRGVGLEQVRSLLGRRGR